MDFSTRCPHCLNTFEAEEAWIGQNKYCPVCGKPIVIRRENCDLRPEMVEKTPGNLRRILARFIDVFLPGWPAVFILAIPVMIVAPAAFDEFESKCGIYYWYLGPVIIGSLMECLIYRLFAWTPGKALFGIRVVDGAGRPLSAKEYCRRDLRMLQWLATGQVLKMAIDRALPAAYDVKSDVQVVFFKRSAFKTVFGTLLAAGMFSLFVGAVVLVVTFDDLEGKATAGDVEAQYKLALAHATGDGASQDLKECAKLLRKAAEQGHSGAQYELGKCLLNGSGVEKDPAEAMSWFRKAAEAGHVEAQSALGSGYLNGVGVGKDPAEAVKWSSKAAEQDNAEAQSNLGYCYEHGIGVEKDLTEALKWYRKSADRGCAKGQAALGFCYLIGRGIEKNPAEAVIWLRKAAEQGNAEAQNNLGHCCEYGIGVEKDLAEAVKWYSRADKSGFAPVKEEVKRLAK